MDPMSPALVRIKDAMQLTFAAKTIDVFLDAGTVTTQMTVVMALMRWTAFRATVQRVSSAAVMESASPLAGFVMAS